MRTMTMSYEEATPMSNDAQAQHAALGPLERYVPMLKTAALCVTIVGAIPTAITAYNAYRFGVPFTEVSERLAQYDLLVKNIDCKIDYKALSTAQGTKVDVGACPKTGDIALKLSTPDGKAAYQWIAYNELQKPGEPPASTSFIDMLIGAARAEGAGKSYQVAEGALEVMCKSLVSKKKLVQIVKEGGKCYKETISPVRGTVDSREEVPCSTQCPGSG